MIEPNELYARLKTVDPVELYSNAFLANDQPTLCPYCQTRTDIIFDLPHSIHKTALHLCLNIHCGTIFLEEMDEEIIKPLG